MKDNVCPVIAQFAIPIQGARPEWCEALKPLLPRLVGSRGSSALTARRMYRCADWAVREVAPLAFDAADMPGMAATLRALTPVTDLETAKGAAQEAAAAHWAAELAAAGRAAEASAHWAAARVAEAAAAAAHWAAEASVAVERGWMDRAADMPSATAEEAARAAEDAADLGANVDTIALLRELLDML